MRPEIAELLANFASAPDRIAEAIAELSPAQLGLRRAPEKWSIQQLVNHLADTELAYTTRVRFTIAEERPPLQTTDQDQWVAHFGNLPVDMALALLRVLREQTTHILEHLPDSAWDRVGVHSTNGDMTLLQMVRTYTNHVDHHLRQIAEIRQVHAV